VKNGEEGLVRLVMLIVPSGGDICVRSEYNDLLNKFEKDYQNNKFLIGKYFYFITFYLSLRIFP